MPSEGGTDWVEAEVIEVCRPDTPDAPHLRPHVVVLRERDGTRRLPMYTGSAEAVALACSLDAGEMPRPRANQLAANLLAAAGSRLAEVRITRLAEGAPIRVDAAILDDPVVDSHPEWEEYPARLADLAAEERQRRADFQARLAQAQESPDQRAP